MGLFSIRHKVQMNTGEIINGMDRLMQAHFASTKDAIDRTAQSVEDLVKDSGAFMSIIGTTVAQLQSFAEDTVTHLLPFITILLICMSFCFLAMTLSFLASAWKKSRKEEARTTNIFLIMSPETRATSRLVDQIIRKQIQN